MLKKFIIVILIVAVYLGISYLLQPKLREVLRAPQAPTQKASESASPQPNQITYDCEGAGTAFDGLVKAAAGKVETKDYSFGKMVNSINGISGGTNNKYWIYFVDGKSASVSADNYKCQGNEKIEWKLLEQK
jgi:hypothetical protein